MKHPQEWKMTLLIEHEVSAYKAQLAYAKTIYIHRYIPQFGTGWDVKISEFKDININLINNILDKNDKTIYQFAAPGK